jgi:hypothetical protein
MSTHPVLRAFDAIKLGELLQAVNKEKHVRWWPVDTDRIYEGTLRHVVVSPDNYNFLRYDEDVRDGYIRITQTTGFETTLSVMEALDLYRNTLLVVE